MLDTPSKTKRSGPLLGLMVIDLTRHYPGPLATRLLAELGARVIKVEFEPHGDPIRQLPPFVDGVAPADMALNAGKESLRLDLAKAEDQALLGRMISAADILIEPFLPGYLDKLKIGYDWARALNERLIWVSLTGYGQSGPRAQEPGHDINYMGLTGMLDLNGTDRCLPFPLQIADTAGGAYMALIAILSAVYERQQSQLGQFVDVSMVDGLLPLMSLQFAHLAAAPNARGQHPLAGQLACYNAYTCADGKSMALGALEAKFWQRFCQSVDKQEWIDRQYSTGLAQQSLKQEVTQLFLSKPQLFWVELGQQSSCCLTPVHALTEVETDPHLAFRDSLVTVDGITRSAPPVRFSRTPAENMTSTESSGTSNNRLRAEFQ